MMSHTGTFTLLVIPYKMCSVVAHTHMWVVISEIADVSVIMAVLRLIYCYCKHVSMHMCIYLFKVHTHMCVQRHYTFHTKLQEA